MPLRQKYGYNCQTMNWGKMYQLVPLCHIEVVPGETIQGSIQANVFSEPTKRPLLNRHYVDVYGFYTPLRLLDSSFPDFVSGRDPSAAPPFVTDTFYENFERKAVIDDTVDKSTAWRGS